MSKTNAYWRRRYETDNTTREKFYAFLKRSNAEAQLGADGVTLYWHDPNPAQPLDVAFFARQGTA